MTLNMSEKVYREIGILRHCSHPHIIRLYDVIETPSDVFVVMKHATNGVLFDFIASTGRLVPDEAKRFFQ